MSDDQESGALGPYNLSRMADVPDSPDSDEAIQFMPLGLDPSTFKAAQPIAKVEREPDPPAGPLPSGDGKYITNFELDVVQYIERYHATQGESPTNVKIKERFPRITSEWLAEFEVNPLVQKSMSVRGITYPNAADVLSDRQLAAVSAMLAYTDRRSDEKKLRDIGVTPREWAGWLQNEDFANYLRDRSERMLNNSMHEAHLGLVKGLRNGNTASIRTYYEITGRYNPNQENQINMRMLLHTFIEVIQRYVHDPVVLHRIATELSNIASRETLGTNGNTIQGKSIKR